MYIPSLTGNYVAVFSEAFGMDLKIVHKGREEAGVDLLFTNLEKRPA